MICHVGRHNGRLIDMILDQYLDGYLNRWELRKAILLILDGR